MAVLAAARFPMKRRAIERAAFGDTGFMAWPTIKAIKSLMEGGYVESAYDPTTAQFDRCYRLTAKDRINADALEAFGGAS